MKIAYVIGRFQPFHNGHKTMLDKALEIADRVIVVIGDTGCRPDYKNPWTVAERTAMIRLNYDEPTNNRLFFTSVEDNPYDDIAWANSVRQAVKVPAFNAEKFLVGFKKDASSFYLELFPEWRYVAIEPVTHGSEVIDATQIRDAFFDASAYVMGVSDITKRWLLQWREWHQNRWHETSAERQAVIKHNAEWDCEAVRKYGGPVIAAVDALLFDDKSVLLIRRKGGVGKGALALPGGFVDPSERLVDAALRELHEETGIKVERGSLAHDRLVPFDHPGRSMRGRIITNVLPIYGPNHFNTKPKPLAGDDAAEAMWVDRDALPSLKREFFSDHFHIINRCLN